MTDYADELVEELDKLVDGGDYGTGGFGGLDTEAAAKVIRVRVHEYMACVCLDTLMRKQRKILSDV